MPDDRVPLGPDSFSLVGRVAIVTGAAVGIGRAIALAFGRFGADLAICDRDEEHLEEVATELRASGHRVVTGVIDVRDTAAVQAFVDRVSSEFVRVDVLVNNAGGGFAAGFLDVNDRGQDALVRENFTSVTNFVRSCVPLMVDGGSIVNITSIEAHRAAPNFAVYSAMKAAVAKPHEVARARARSPDDPGQLHRARRDPDAGHRRGRRAHAAADRRPRRRRRRRRRLPRERRGAFVTGTTIHVDGGNLARRRLDPPGRRHLRRRAEPA